MAAHRVLVLVLALAAASAALGQRERGHFSQDRLLDEIVRANENLKARGTRVVTFRFVRDGKSQSKSITEVVVRDGQKSRTETNFDDAKQPATISVDDGKFRYHFDPKANVINKTPSLQHQNAERLELLMREKRGDYSITVRDGGKVADKSTFLVTLKDDKGIEHRIWVERSGKAILKREFSGPDADRGVSFVFTSFSYLRSVDPSEFTINKPGVKVLEPIDRLRAAAQKLQYGAYRIVNDQKFQLYEASSYETEAKQKILRSTYSDGTVVVSLVQVKGEIDESKLKQSRGGIPWTVKVWKKDGYSFALVGSLTAQELERLARLVRR